MKRLRFRSTELYSTLKNLSAKICFLILILATSFSSNAQTIEYDPIIVDDYYPDGVITETKYVNGKNLYIDNGGPAIKIITQKKVIIENCTITSKGYGITNYDPSGNFTVDVNIQIRNCRFTGIDPDTEVDYNAFERAIKISKAKEIIIVNNYFNKTGGILIDRFSDNAASDPSANRILIRRNRSLNIIGGVHYTSKDVLVYETKNGETYVVKDHRQFLQLRKVYTAEEVDISWNEIINEADTDAATDKSFVEDNISVYVSRGTSSQPIRIHNNYIKGAYPGEYLIDTFSIKPYSGGGIMVADAASEIINNDPVYVRYVYAYYNQVVSSANYGMAIAGGSDNRIYNNTILHSGKVKKGTTWVDMWARDHGIYVNNYGNPDYFGNHLVNKNLVGFMSGAETRKDWFSDPSDNCTPACSQTYLDDNNTHYGGSVGYVVNTGNEFNESLYWVDSLRKYNIIVGLTNKTTLEAETFDNSTDDQPDVYFSGDKAARLLDLGSNITANLNITTTGDYYIRARVRSGSWTPTYSTGSMDYWPNGYVFNIDNSANNTTFEGVPGTVSGQLNDITGFGDCHWGTMVSENKITLSQGTHTLKITANKTVGGVDFIEVYPASNTTLRLATSEIPEENREVSEKKLTIFPNPGKGNFTIAGFNHENNASVTISDSYGTLLVRKFSINITGNEGRINLNDFNRSLPGGVYLFKITTGNRTYVQKVMVAY